MGIVGKKNCLLLMAPLSSLSGGLEMLVILNCLSNYLKQNVENENNFNLRTSFTCIPQPPRFPFGSPANPSDIEEFFFVL